MDKGLLFATSRRKIKNHVVESQIKFLVWLWLSLTEKQPMINHISLLIIQLVSFTSAANSYMNELWQTLIVSISSSV